MTVPNDVYNKLVEIFDGMSKATGYGFDYDNINERHTCKKTYPNLILEAPEDIFRPVDTQVINAYSVDTPFGIKVTVPKTNNTVKEDLNQVQEDIERVLEENADALQCVGLLLGDFLSSSKVSTHVRARPGNITLIYNGFIRVKRSNPSLIQ